SAELDPDTSDNSATVINTTNTSGWANMAITKNVDIPDPYIGENVVFTITAQRIASGGDSPQATNVRVIDLLPSGYTYVGHTAYAGTTYNQSTGLWIIGTVNDNTARTLQITATPLAS